MQGIVPLFRTPSDVREEKVRVDAQVRALDRAVAACAGLNAQQKQAWLDFWNSWVLFRDSEDSWFHAAAQYERCEAYQRDAYAWQAEVAKASCEAGPSIQLPPDASSSDIVSAIKFAAVAVVVAAAVYGITRVV